MINGSTKNAAIATYLIILHVLLVILIVKTNFIPRVINKLGYAQPSEELGEYYYKQLAFQHRVDKNLPSQSIIFIGDSHIASLAVSAISDHSVNWGIGKDTTWGVLQRISTYASLDKAKLIVIAIGFNDLAIRSDNEITQNYRAIITRVPPHIPILFNTILPVNETVKNSVSLNQRIININKALQDICNQSERLDILDMTDVLIGKQTSLRDQYYLADGIHLSQAGNQLWISNIKAFILHDKTKKSI
ncbi:GDSL-type esterase/lipase family protein [Neptunicella sp.]|uniref:GDSL-type esterase/lipase family protein n=1 Tax=Neptunicella sp. TaxID=2125986 RepID=UPI003F692FEA